MPARQKRGTASLEAVPALRQSQSRYRLFCQQLIRENHRLNQETAPLLPQKSGQKWGTQQKWASCLESLRPLTERGMWGLPSHSTHRGITNTHSRYKGLLRHSIPDHAEATAASDSGAPVQTSGHPGQSCPLYLPRMRPISRTAGNKICWIATGGMSTRWVRRCRHRT